MAKPIYTSISNVVIQRACSPLGQTVFTHQYQTQLYRGRALLQGRQYLYINIRRSYIEDVLSFRADSILHQYQTQLYRGRSLLQGRQYLYINIKGSYIEDVLSFRADSINTSILDVVIQRTCSPLGQTVLIYVNIKRSYIEDVLSFRADSILDQYQTRTSISNVVIQRTCSPLGQTVFIHQYQTQLYRGRALLQARQYIYINSRRSYIEDVLSFRAGIILHQYQT